MNRRELLERACLAGAFAAAGAIGALLSPVVPRRVRPVWTAGDSIGVGLGLAGSVPSVARNGVALRQVGQLTEQLLGTPNDARVYLSTGTNDAKAGSVDDPLVYLKRLTAVWGDREIIIVGPPMVLAPWDGRAQTMDEWLANDTPQVGFKYISIREASKGLKRDAAGVHFTAAGYRKLWETITG